MRAGTDGQTDAWSISFRVERWSSGMMGNGGQGSGGSPGVGRDDSEVDEMIATTEEVKMRRDPRLDSRVQGEIGKHLRAIYDPVVNEPVPAKFMDLLEQLERSTQKN